MHQNASTVIVMNDEHHIKKGPPPSTMTTGLEMYEVYVDL